MDKNYQHKDIEEKIYKNWEEKGYFKPEVNPDGEPYTIILPPPNANGDLHFGHAMFVIEDILIRYHRMKGFSTLWLPGTDHAGTETQFVFEKKLQAEGKSRFDFSREELYKQIWDYVAANRGGIENQLRRLGFSLDWSREKFTLDEDIVKIVKETFRKMYDDGLVYRDYRLVNYCTRDGTSFSDLEVVYEEKVSPFYYMKYGEFTIGTVRPETKFRDTALAVNPEDPRYKDKIGKTYEIMGLLGPVQMKIIADPGVDPEFGTGIMKVTPAHDPHDFELGKQYDLPVTPIIGFDGKMDFSWFLNQENIEPKYKARAEKYHGKYVKEVRKLMVEDLKEDGLLLKTDENYTHRIGVCYKCKTVLEPLPLEQWYVKVKPLTEKALEAIEKEVVKVFPNNFRTILEQWYKNLRDWNISRQSVWGIQIPVWYSLEKNPTLQVTYVKNDGQIVLRSGEGVLEKDEFEEAKKGLQKIIAPMQCTPEFEPSSPNEHYLQETDTFDTWFSSGQWPYVTLKTANPGDFEKFYPTSVMETGRDILFFWVSRMIMLGIYLNEDKKELKEQIPYRNVLLHGMVLDPLGKKMSKSKGNVVNPLQVADEYGADAVRFALVYGTGTGNDQAMSYPKLDAAKKFANKLWNMARFIEMKREQATQEAAENENDKEWVKKVEDLTKEITKYIDSYQFNLAAERLYEFVWHEFADKYIEDVKNRIDKNSFKILNELFVNQLKLLHPFMPFITEEIYQKLGGEGSIMVSTWPTTE